MPSFRNPPQKKEPGANRQALQNALEGYKLPRVDVADPKAIAERIEMYLQYCLEHDISPGVAGCANWLGVAVETVQAWYSGRRGSPEHQRVASRFYGIIQDIWQSDMHEGAINPVSGIFMGKAFYGYKDTQEIVVQQTTRQELSIADLIAESKRLPGAENCSLPDNGNNNTIDADYRVLEDDVRYEKAAQRKEAQDAWRLKPEERLERNREKNRKYYHAKRAEALAYRKMAAERDKAAREAKEAKKAEKAQKGRRKKKEETAETPQKES